MKIASQQSPRLRTRNQLPMYTYTYTLIHSHSKNSKQLCCCLPLKDVAKKESVPPPAPLLAASEVCLDAHAVVLVPASRVVAKNPPRKAKKEKGAKFSTSHAPSRVAAE